MKKVLYVYIRSDCVGNLFQDEGGQIFFTYENEWLESSGAFPLSCSLPLRKEPFSQKECRGFFAGLLPEESVRLDLSRLLGISARNDYALLKEIGGECAGAISFLPEGNLPETLKYSYRLLDENSFYDLLKALPTRPFLADEPDLRLSLAGAQTKMALYVDKQGHFYLPLGGAPSTHILKPASSRFSNLVDNEFLCLYLARALDIPSAEAERGRIKDQDYLLIKRYDRYQEEGSSYPIRRHQEDFCQALGVTPERKYQNEGGPSLKETFSLVRSTSSLPAVDLQNILKIVILNILIGNHDAHGKNFSLLYTGSGRALRRRLAPAYDLLSTVYYPELTPKMAMKIGNRYESLKINSEDLKKFSEETGLSFPAVKKQFVTMSKEVFKILKGIEGSYPEMKELIDMIETRCEIFISKFEV